MRVFRWRHALSFLLLLIGAFFAKAQTNSIASGNWSDATVWSTGAVPGATTTVNVNNPLVLDANISITSGVYTFNKNVTDLSGGTSYGLTMSGGSLDITAGTTTFEGNATFTNCTVTIRSGATLILGDFTKNDKCDLVVEAGGTLIVNGTLSNSDNQGSFVIYGLVQVNGDYLAASGSSAVTGTGDLLTNGFIFGSGSSEVFGSKVDCTAPACSGNNLCSFNNLIGASQAVCIGSTVSALTTSGTSAGAGATYQWQKSTTSSSSGFSDISGANSESYTPPALTQTTWYKRVVTLSGCTGYSYPVKVTIVPDGGWRGTTSTDWNTGSNWCGGTVPVSTTDVVIPKVGNGVPLPPTTTAAAACHDLIIEDDAAVTVGGSNSFAIYGDFTNNGSLTTNSSTVSLSGSSQQTVSGNPITFYNLTINNTSPNTVVVNSFLTTRNILTLTTGNINMSGYNFILGLSASTPGTLSRTSGHFYNGYLTRWFNTSAITIGEAAGLFPVGTNTDYRPFYLGHSVAFSTGGSIRVLHVGATTTTDVSFPDDSPNIVVRRHDSQWIVTKLSTLNAGGNLLDLRVEATGLGSISDVTDLRLTLAGGVVGVPETNAGTVTNPQVNRTGVADTELNNTFYVSSINSIASPLPLSLVSFQGDYSADGVSLEWRTVSEENFDHFLVERSEDGISFEPVGRVTGKGGSNIAASYTYVDESAQVGRYYYRLKMIDADESFFYSKIISVIAGEQGESLSFYPNPVKQKRFTVNLKGAASAVHFILYDQYGRIYMDQELSEGENEILISQNLSGGVYLAKVLGMSTPKIIKLVIY
jgi:hypothetical protein